MLGNAAPEGSGHHTPLLGRVDSRTHRKTNKQLQVARSQWTYLAVGKHQPWLGGAPGVRASRNCVCSAPCDGSQDGPGGES